MLVIALLAALDQGTGIVNLRVTAAGAPVAAAQVLVNGAATMTDVDGVARLQLTPGQTQVTVAKAGFLPVTLAVSVAEGQEQSLVVELDSQPTLEEHVTVSATRTDARIEDQAMRVEVLGLEDNPYRSQSASYVLFGGLAERRFGRWRVFANVENIGNVRQTDWEPLVRAARAADGRWTVDAWAPLDGRVFNGGVRLSF